MEERDGKNIRHVPTDEEFLIKELSVSTRLHAIWPKQKIFSRINDMVSKHLKLRQMEFHQCAVAFATATACMTLPEHHPYNFLRH